MRPISLLVALLAIVSTPFAATAQPNGSEPIDALVQRDGFAGEVLIARGDTVLVHKAYGTEAPAGGPAHRTGALWRLASITKQVTAALIVGRHVEALDKPISATKGAEQTVTLRQLLTHHSGLANPDDTPAGADGMPAFYKRAAPDIRYCRSRPPHPSSDFAYNNCDYLIAADTFPDALAWPKGMRMAAAGEVGVVGFVGGKAEPRFELASFGASGGLLGTAEDLLRFDRALMSGMLISATARSALWTPESGGSAQALGQWVYAAPLKGCAEPVRIVQRDGDIQGVQTRNVILPDRDMAVILFTNRSSDDFRFGDVWTGSGFLFDLLSAAACGKQ